MDHHRLGLYARRLMVGIAILVLILLTGSSVAAQLLTGGISGTVSDPSGASIAKANVRLTSEVRSGLSLNTSTDPSGRFVFTGLEPGVYTLSVTQTGFTTAEVKN